MENSLSSEEVMEGKFPWSAITGTFICMKDFSVTLMFYLHGELTVVKFCW